MHLTSASIVNRKFECETAFYGNTHEIFDQYEIKRRHMNTLITELYTVKRMYNVGITIWHNIRYKNFDDVCAKIFAPKFL